MTTPFDLMPELQELDLRFNLAADKADALEVKFDDPKSGSIRFLPKTVSNDITTTELFEMCCKLTMKDYEAGRCYFIADAYQPDYSMTQNFIEKEHGYSPDFYSTMKALGHVKIRNLSIAEGLGLVEAEREKDQCHAAWSAKFEETLMAMARYVPKNEDEAKRKKAFLEEAFEHHSYIPDNALNFINAMIAGLSPSEKIVAVA